MPGTLKKSFDIPQKESGTVNLSGPDKMVLCLDCRLTFAPSQDDFPQTFQGTAVELINDHVTSYLMAAAAWVGYDMVDVPNELEVRQSTGVRMINKSLMLPLIGQLSRLSSVGYQACSAPENSFIDFLGIALQRVRTPKKDLQVLDDEITKQLGTVDSVSNARKVLDLEFIDTKGRKKFMKLRLDPEGQESQRLFLLEAQRTKDFVTFSYRGIERASSNIVGQLVDAKLGDQPRTDLFQESQRLSGPSRARRRRHYPNVFIDTRSDCDVSASNVKESPQQ